MGERAEVNGVTLAYEVAGAGPRLVWCHGLASCMEGDRDLVDAFAERFTVLAYDARGHGDYSHVRDSAAFSYRELAADLAALLDHVGWTGVVLAGSSMGAATGARVACLRRDLAAALVMVRPAARGPGGAAPDWLRMLFAAGAHAIRTGGIEAAIQFLMSIPQAREELESAPARLEQLRRDWARHDPLSIAAALEGIPPTPPLADGLTPAMIECPTLVIPGNDLIHPAESGREVASLIPGAVLGRPFDGMSRADEVASLVEQVRGFLGAEEAAR
jgi:pimeloyl-ACP methyl ester carboxylesterase